MRKLLLASAIVPLGTLACIATPVSAQTVVQREVVITEREVPTTTIIERRYREAATARYYYRAPRDVETRSGYLTVVESGGCGWLHRRATETGSDYWWERYNDCRDND